MKTRSIALNLLLLALLSNCSHETSLPDVTYFGAYFDTTKPGFYGVDKSGEKVYKPLEDNSMHGAQCLKIDDFYRLQEYLEGVREREILGE